MATAADVFFDTIYDWGVEVVFGLPGDGINGLMEALRQRQGSGKARPLDAKAGLGGDPARILELKRDEAVSPGGKGLGTRHRALLLLVTAPASPMNPELSSRRTPP